MANRVLSLTKWGAVLAAVLALSVHARAAEPQSPPASSSPSPTLVFVTKSDACDCVASLCVAAELQVRNFLADNPWGFLLEKVDLAETPEAAREFAVLTVPVVFLVDSSGYRAARFDGFVDAKEFRAAWETYWDGEGK